MLITPTIRAKRTPPVEPSRSFRSPIAPRISETRTQHARVGRDVADAEPGGLELVRVVLLRRRPLGADPHDEVGGEHADE